MTAETEDQIVSSPLKASMAQHGMAHIEGWIDPDLLGALSDEVDALFEECALSTAGETPLTDTQINATGRGKQAFAVPEIGDEGRICRLEFLVGASSLIAEFVSSRLTPFLQRQFGETFCLLKDKCNLKPPGGEGFGPHQDVVAYKHFGAVSHLTAAVPLSASTLENGCLEFSDPAALPGAAFDTWLGPRRESETISGGKHHGEIATSVAKTLSWRAVSARPGDLVLFDSFVPHQSGPNRTQADRKILFFTYIVGPDAPMSYTDYYREKFGRPDNPIFHIATPTKHSESMG